MSPTVTKQLTGFARARRTTPFWVSFLMDPDVLFTLHSPWWRTGWDSNDRPIVCAAVLATSEADAKTQIADAHDRPVSLDWRFVEEQPADWSPFNDRFRRADWMVWP